MFEHDSSAVPTTRQWQAAIVCLIILLGAGLYRIHALLYEQARNTAEQQLHSVASLKSWEIKQWLDDRLVFLSEPPDGIMAKNFARLLSGREAAAAQVLQARFRYMRAKIPEITSIWLYDPAGHPLLGSNTPHSRFDERHREAARKVLEKRLAGFVDFHRTGGASGDVVLDLLVPLIVEPAGEATMIGYALFQIDPRQKLYPLLSQWPAPSASAESFLVRREGAEVVFLSPLRHLEAEPLSLRRPIDAPRFITSQTLRGDGEVLAGVDYRGEPALGVALGISGTDWRLVAKMDDSEIFLEARRSFLWIGAASLIFLAALLVLGRIFVVALRAREREARYRLIAESGSDMVWLYELATRRFTYVSPSVEQLRGYTVTEALQQTMQDVLTPESYRMINEELPRWVANFTAGNESVRTRHYEVSQARKDGTAIQTEAVATLITDAHGQVTHIQGISRDITERRRIEAALAESEDKFRTIYDSINDAIFIHDVDSGRILEVNASASQMYGYSREQLLSLDLAEISASTAPYTLKAALGYLRLARENGWQAFEWLARDQTNRQFWVAVNLKTLNIGGNQRILAVVRDIDSRKRAEQELKLALTESKVLNRKLAEAQSQLLQSEKMASIGQLAAGVAHELNNPIGFVSSNLGTLESYLQDIFAIFAAYESAEATVGVPSPQLDAVRSLKTQKDFDYLKNDIVQLMAESRDGLTRVAKIVRDLKDFSRAGEATYQWADLHQGLDSTLNIVWNELKYKCTVKKEYGELPPVWCVPSQLNQVFMNLLVNAAHAIPEKGDITIRTGRQDNEVFVAIADTGTGISPEHLNRLFEPFFTTKPVGKGTGLGLSLAYSIVQKHQGRFEVHSKVGEGSSFTVWLPIEAKRAETIASPLPQETPSVTPAF
ncbi:MAG: PAS domain S-box protein [Sterolibacterium sp.]|nr:PAS domain S-box protein [Sterolibacterium sp.]